MIDNATILLRYCEKFLVENFRFSQYIQKQPNFIFPLLPKNKLPADSLEPIFRISIALAMQKNRTLNYFSLIDKFQTYNRKYVGMKGIFLQKAYYPETHTRLFGDIDIIAKIEDGYALYQLLKKSDFKLEKAKKFTEGTHGLSILRRFYLMHTQHIELYKRDSLTGLNIHLDLHANINANSPSSKVTFNINRMIRESIQKTVENVDFFVFSPEDHLLYLMFHTIKHLSYITYYANKKAINLQSLYDVAQVIAVENVDWEKFSRHAIEYNITPHISFFTKIYLDIFENSIPENVILSIAAHALSLKFKWKPIYKKIMNKKSCDLIIGDYSDLKEIEDCYASAQQSHNPGKIWRSIQ
jgi:hypothetical protein